MSLRAIAATVPGRLGEATCTLAPGEVTAICGPNGAGKSTLLAVLAGLLAPAAGRVELDGRALGELAPHERARAIGYLPQAREVAWDIDVATLAALGRIPWRASASDDAEAVSAALAALDLGDLAARPVSRLSGGELARALLARVVAGTPRWILADEPFAALDLAHQVALLRHLREQAERGVGVALVVHDLALAMNRADRAIVLDRGRIVAAGPPRAVLTPECLRAVWRIEAEWIETRNGLALAFAG